MSKRVLLLVEGQTEERFVKDILEPAYLSKNIYFYPTLLVTKRAKNGPNFKGGVTNFAKFHNDVQRLLNSAGNALVSTMLDYYALPNDFPGMKPRYWSFTIGKSGTHRGCHCRSFWKATEFHPIFSTSRI